MSPKSRGRAHKSSRKGPTPSRHRRERGVIERCETFLSSPVQIWESVASDVLSQAWAAAPLTERDPELVMAARLVKEFEQGSSPAGPYLLAAVQLVYPTDLVADALEGVELPAWAGSPVPEPLHAWTCKDVYDEQQLFLLEYSDHCLVASLDYVGGVTFTSIGLTDAGDVALPRLDQAMAAGSTLGQRQEITVQEACSQLLHAGEALDRYWPRERDDEVTPNRLLLRRRVAPFADPYDWQPLPDEQRETLITTFLEGRDPEDGYLAGVFFDFSEGYLHTPLLWGPDAAAYFLLDYVPRKVFLDDRDTTRLIPALHDWIDLVLTQHGLDEEARRVVHDVVDECGEDFTGGAEGSDPADVRARNAQRLAQTMAEAQRESRHRD